MFAAAPVVVDGVPVAVLGLRLRPEEGFSRILTVARSGETGETYAFDKNGLMLSQSRFDKHLEDIGMAKTGAAILSLEIRDPGANLVEGETPRQGARPLTRMASSAVKGGEEVDVEGYRDYRGVPVVGAWTWISDYGFGVTTEADVVEAYAPLNELRFTFFVILAFAAAGGALAIFGAAAVSRFRLRMDQAIQRAARLGQYTLKERIGQGGMGEVYVADHAMLRRPTAIKLVGDEAKNHSGAIERFEREVQHTSQLTHPNTIAIYDFGRTEEGVFYYAMEYLNGYSLNAVVDVSGPLPAARVVWILQQVCGSLAEAHRRGLIHRDIKPANIMLCERGGVYDFVKVLDFGLVKNVEQQSGDDLTRAKVVGTPAYMAPEMVKGSEIDARSDVYAVGAVGYYLLTGEHAFSGDLHEVLLKKLSEKPVPPSQHPGVEVPEPLETLLLRCLAQDRAQRPTHGAQLQRLLVELRLTAWGPSEATAWWEKLGPELDRRRDAAIEPAREGPRTMRTLVDFEP